MQPEPKDEREIQSIVRQAVEDCVDHVEAEISPKRIKYQDYYDGNTYLSFEENTSSCVSTKCRDVVRQVLPSIMRVFMTSSRPCEFIPNNPQQVAMAQQCTEMVHYTFQTLHGFKVLQEAITDSLVKAQGIVKVYHADDVSAKTYTYTDLSEDELNYLTDDPDVTVISQEMEMRMQLDEFGMDVEQPVFSCKVSKEFRKGEIRMECVPPEEFYISSSASTFNDAVAVVHRTEMSAGDVVQMGFDPEIVFGLSSFEGGTDTIEEEKRSRRGYYDGLNDDDNYDPAIKRVTISECYMKLDIDGTGIPVLYKFLLGGTSYEILDYEECDEIPFIKLEPIPEPHTFYGKSLVEMVVEDQDAATSILRGILNNVALTNNPRMAFIEGQVSVPDLLNGELGGLVRMRQPGAVQALSVPFAAGQTLSALQYLDKLVEQKTGVTNNLALNPDALQSTTKAAVTASVEAAAGQTEVMVRNLAEGLRDLYGLLMRLLRKNTDEQKYMRLNGQFIPVDPRVWENMDMEINVGLGTGREAERAAALQQALQMQMQIYQSMGPMNGLVSMTNIRNTLADMLSTQGVRNPDRYFAPLTPEIEAQMLQMQQQQQAQMAQQQAQQPDPATVMMQAEQMKAQTKMQTDMAKLQLDQQKMMMQDDLERDKMAQEMITDAAQLAGKYSQALDVEAIRAEQRAPRN